MLPIVSLLVVVTLSVLVTRIATEALVLTGLSRESAVFQARSAFSGVGFTTQESEAIVSHPVRRRIVLSLMLVGNAGIVSAVASLLITFVEPGMTPGASLLRVLWLLLGLWALWLLTRSVLLGRLLSTLIRATLERWTDLRVHDYEQLLQLGGEYEVTTLPVRPGGWLAERTVQELDLPAEGVNILSIRRSDGRFMGVPRGETRLVPGDQLTVYGRRYCLSQLHARRQDAAGEADRRAALERQTEALRRQQRHLGPSA